MRVRFLLVLAGLVMGASAGVYAARNRVAVVVPPSPSAPISGPRELRVPKLTGPIALDGETGDPGWRQVGRTGTFLSAEGQPARPYSEARFAWGDGKLWVLLYAADEDIRSDTDSFHLVIGSQAFDVSPLGKATLPGVESAHDVDGTVDDPKDNDEEWVLELAIPLSLLDAEPKSGTRLVFSVHRCDTPHDSERTCAQWGEKKPAVLVFE